RLGSRLCAARAGRERDIQRERRLSASRDHRMRNPVPLARGFLLFGVSNGGVIDRQTGIDLLTMAVHLRCSSGYVTIDQRKPTVPETAAKRRETDRAINTVWRLEQARLIAGLTRMVRDISLAEELAQEALVAALRSWPETGVPRNPGA